MSLVGQRAYVGLVLERSRIDPDKLQFILNPRDVAAVWKSKSLSLDALIEDGLVTMFGVTPKGVQQLQSDPDGKGPLLLHNHTYLKESLASGGSLEVLTRGFVDYLDIELQKVSNQGTIEVGLQEWVRLVLTVASTNASLGPEILKQEPELITRLWEWERDFQTLTLGLPAWMMKRAHKNRELMIQGFSRHVSDKNALEFLRHLVVLMRRRGMSDRDIGAGNFSFWSA